MKPLIDVAGMPLEWVRVGGRRTREFELRAQDHVVGILQFAGRLGTRARARLAAGAWYFEGAGLLARSVRITAEEAPAGTPAAEVTPGWPAKRWIRTGGEAFAWRRVGLLSRRRVVLDAAESPVIRCRPVGIPVVGRGVLEVEAAAFGHPQLPVLVAAAWYLVARRQGREGAA